MVALTSLPKSVSLYDVVRAYPTAGPRLASVGLTREFYDYRLRDAARAAHVPMARLDPVMRG